jgi:hypothetical protein
MAIITLNNNSLSSVTSLPAGVGGKVLQVVNSSSTTTATTTSTSFVDSNLSASITPSSTSNKIFGTGMCFILQSQAQHEAQYAMFRDSTQLNSSVWSFGVSNHTTSAFIPCTFSFFDSPSSINALNYKLKFLTTNASSQSNVYRQQYMTLMEIKG